MNEFITLMELNTDSRFQTLNEDIRKALEKETDIPKEYIPQDMNDNLQKLLGCGKYGKEIE